MAKKVAKKSAPKKTTKKSGNEPRLLIREFYDKRVALAEKRGEPPFSWREFARAMGMTNLEGPNSSRSNIAKILGEDYNPTFLKLCDIAKALEVKVSDLIQD